MKFENYARDWLDRQTFSKSIRKTTRQSLDYICKAVGELEIEDISESDIDEIYYMATSMLCLRRLESLLRLEWYLD